MLKSLLCSFFIFTIILLSIALLISRDYLDFSAQFVQNGIDFTLFGNTVRFDTAFLSTADRLLQFNDIIFGNGFSQILKYTAKNSALILRDIAIISYNSAKTIVGAK